MEFTVNKSDLVRELSLSQGVVEKKTTIPILSNVLLEAADDRLTLTATDLELGIRCSCPARVKKEGAGTVPARTLDSRRRPRNRRANSDGFSGSSREFRGRGECRGCEDAARPWIRHRIANQRRPVARRHGSSSRCLERKNGHREAPHRTRCCDRSAQQSRVHSARDGSQSDDGHVGVDAARVDRYRR